MSKANKKPEIKLLTNPKAVVGVLTTPNPKSIYGFPKGKSAKFDREIIIEAHNMGILMYCFYPEDINWRDKKIIGYTYITQGNKSKWIRKAFPLPHIVYNRLKFRKHEAQKDVQSLLAKLEKEPEIYLFNSRFLNKWEVHQSLSQNPLTSDLVPETCLYSQENLNLLLNKYQSLFIKQINNSIGKGIITVKRKSNSKYVMYKYAASDLGWKICAANQLYTCLKRVILHENKYMIQKAIDLASVGNRIFDLRSEVQKNGQGQWVLIGVGVRIAAHGKYVTHVPNGGSKAVYEDVVDKVFQNKPAIKQQLDEQLDYICRNVPRVLEESLNLSLGILSIDIGINKEGKMQVIEVNSKPAGFDEEDIRKKHDKNLNEYFLYIVNSGNFIKRKG
ncbi:MAG: YheC/YheD family protein [Syntrophomonas sp.]|nr:YheC/YheD family protein [Syntrophomonas sp.]